MLQQWGLPEPEVDIVLSRIGTKKGEKIQKKRLLWNSVAWNAFSFYHVRLGRVDLSEIENHHLLVLCNTCTAEARKMTATRCECERKGIPIRQNTDHGDCTSASWLGRLGIEGNQRMEIQGEGAHWAGTGEWFVLEPASSYLKRKMIWCLAAEGSFSRLPASETRETMFDAPACHQSHSSRRQPDHFALSDSGK